MNKILTYFFSFYSIVVLAQDQPYLYELEAKYSMTSQPDSTDINSLKTETMVLYVGKEQSLFASVRYIAMDSAMTNEIKKGNKFGPSLSFYQEKGTKTSMSIFKTPKEVIYYGRPAPFLTTTYKYIEDKPLMDWEIKNDTLSISGILCQKATTSFGGRNWTAWFSSSIPISDGPYKFSGLPGLIFKIQDEKEHYVFDLIQVRPILKRLQFNFNNKNPESILSKEYYLKEKRFKMDNRLQIMQSRGWNFEDPMQARKTYEENAKKDNNWIELLEKD